MTNEPNMKIYDVETAEGLHVPLNEEAGVYVAAHIAT